MVVGHQPHAAAHTAHGTGQRLGWGKFTPREQAVPAASRRTYEGLEEVVECHRQPEPPAPLQQVAGRTGLGDVDRTERQERDESDKGRQFERAGDEPERDREQQRERNGGADLVGKVE